LKIQQRKTTMNEKTRRRKLLRDLSEFARKFGAKLTATRSPDEVREAARLHAYRLDRKHRNRRARHARAVNKRNRK
jgi:hypothetical protein